MVRVLDKAVREEIGKALNKLRPYRSLHQLLNENRRLFKELAEASPEKIWIQGMSQIKAYLRCWLTGDEDELEMKLDEFHGSPTSRFLREWEKLFPSWAPF